MGKLKYIIKNCPSLRMYNVFGVDDRPCCYNKMKYCEECPDCVMKDIVELCKENLNSLETYVDVRSYECTILQNILKLLDIQEVE